MTSLADGSWETLIDRFYKFAVMPCLRGIGPYKDCGEADTLRVLVEAQLAEARKDASFPRRPDQLTQLHVNKLTSMKTAGRGPEHRALWKGLWRAILFDRDDYTCCFCHRSGEEGLEITNH